MTILKSKNFVALILGPVRHKVVEFQVSRWSDTKLFDFEFVRRLRTEDHEGFEITVTMFRIEFTTGFYDNRHADRRYPQSSYCTL